jgi:hypothetical protein
MSARTATEHNRSWQGEIDKKVVQEGEVIEGGASGGPVVTEDCELIAIVSNCGEPKDDTPVEDRQRHPTDLLATRRSPGHAGVGSGEVRVASPRVARLT